MSTEVSEAITAIATVVLAVGAIFTAAYAIKAFGKQSDQLELQRQAYLHNRVWSILTSKTGLRTVLALYENGDTTDRATLLRRTAYELDVAGAKTLGDGLRDVLRQEHPQDKDVGTTERSPAERFVDSAIEFLNAPPA
jgi:hypothetical protein